MTSRAVPPAAGRRRMRAVVRSLTSASPRGRNATPHGTCRPVAITRAAGGPAAGAGVVAGAVAGAPPSPPVEAEPPSPPPQEASARTARKPANVRARRLGMTGLNRVEARTIESVRADMAVDTTGQGTPPPKGGGGTAGGGPEGRTQE